MKIYKVVSTAGAEWAGVEEGSEIERDLDPGTERALLAAGWLEELAPAKKER